MMLDGVVDIPVHDGENAYKKAFRITEWLRGQGLTLDRDYRWHKQITVKVNEAPKIRFEFRDPKWITMVTLKYC